MQGNSVQNEASAATVEQEFLEMFCSDPELLAAEFDAIIAAEWPTPPTSSSGSPHACRGPGELDAGHVIDGLRDARAVHQEVNVAGRAWQRSPPGSEHVRFAH